MAASDDDRQSTRGSAEPGDEPCDDQDPVDHRLDHRHDRPGAPAPPVRQSRARSSALALSMFALDEALGRKVREEAPIVVAANDDPLDIDDHGISVGVDPATTVVAPAQPRPDPFAPKRRRRRRAADRTDDATPGD